MAGLLGHRFVVGEWTAEPRLNRILNGRYEVRLEPRVMDLLVFLVNRAGEVASRVEIIDTLWTEQYVADSVLTRAVSLLRGALGDDPQAPSYVETIPKRGYRLMAPVSECAPLAETEATPVLLIDDRQYPLTDQEIILGRDLHATIRLHQPKVSRHHARIRLNNGRPEIEDLGSKNGTLVNGVPVTDAVPLRNGDQIIVGSVVAVYREPWTASTMTDARSATSETGIGAALVAGRGVTDDGPVT